MVSSKVKNGSLTVSDISAASLSKLGRVAIASGHVNLASNASSRVVQVSITAPSKGFVLVNGWVNTYGASGQYTVRVWDDGAATHSPYQNGDYVTAGESTCGNTGVFPVAAGVQKFSVRIESNTAGDMEAWGTITAQFIPYNGIGTKTAP